MTAQIPELSVRVAAKTPEAIDICSYELVSVDGSALPPFTAGSHIDVQIRSGLVRQYSLVNHPSETHRYRIAVLREPASRGGSAGMHDDVHVGDILRISHAKNHFQLHPGAQHSLLMAGGIGVTPLLCMAEQLTTSGGDFTLHYCTRSRGRTAFADLLASGAFAPRVRFHFDDGPAEQRLDVVKVLAEAATGTHVYVCGPKGFMEFVLNAARAAGLPEERLHAEYFAAGAQDHSTDTAFEVELATSGRVIAVSPGKTVVQALAEDGIEIPTSCEQGVCGTCLTRIVAGMPDHRDAYLTADEKRQNDCFLPCCSRARTPRLVLDI